MTHRDGFPRFSRSEWRSRFREVEGSGSRRARQEGEGRSGATPGSCGPIGGAVDRYGTAFWGEGRTHGSSWHPRRLADRRKMSLSDSTAPARVAMCPGLPIQVAMCLSGCPENRSYEAVTGERFMGEFGERQPARRRGSTRRARHRSLRAASGLHPPDSGRRALSYGGRRSAAEFSRALREHICHGAELVCVCTV